MCKNHQRNLNLPQNSSAMRFQLFSLDSSLQISNKFSELIMFCKNFFSLTNSCHFSRQEVGNFLLYFLDPLVHACIGLTSDKHGTNMRRYLKLKFKNRLKLNKNNPTNAA